MKNLIVGLVLGLLLNGLTTIAKEPEQIKEKVIINPKTSINIKGAREVYTTKITTVDGVYRVFVFDSVYGSAMTVIRLNSLYK